VSRPELIVPDWPAPETVRAFTTTRQGGFSAGAYAELNLGDHVADDPAVVARNRQRLIQLAALPTEPCWLRQVHGVQGVKAGSAAEGAEADWSWSDTSKTICTVMTADCLPLLMCTIDGTLIAAVHAGWRGMCAGVIEQAVAGLMQRGADPQTLLVWLGPAIGAAAYEVDAVVYDAFVQHEPACGRAFSSSVPGRWQFSLYAAAREILSKVGVTQIFGGDFCTWTDAHFYSYRRQPGCGRQASLIWLEH
jgi:YfiH family protein